MKLRLIAVGKMKKGPEAALVEDYLARARPLLRRMGFTSIEVLELPESRARDTTGRRREEAEAIRKAAGEGAPILLLDERGQTPDSRAFAALLRRLAQSGAPRLAVVIGGPDGVDAALRERAAEVIAFGRLTLPHRLARVMLAEQLYRAATIAANHPYHRD